MMTLDYPEADGANMSLLDEGDYYDMMQLPPEEDLREQRFRMETIFWFEGVLLPVVGFVGVLGNILSILVLRRRDLDLKGSFINLLINLCVYDMLFIVAVNLFYTLPIHSQFYEHELIPYVTPLLLPAIHIVLTGSVFSVVAVAVERYMIICNPFQWATQGNGLAYIIAIAVFSLLYNVNKFFEVQVGYATFEQETWSANGTVLLDISNVTKAIVTITSLRDNEDYTKTVIMANFVVMVVLPLVILSICHVLTFRRIHENTARHNAISSHQRRDNEMAILFFIIISFFVLCHSGKFVLNFFEIYQIFTHQKEKEWPLWAFLLTRVNHLALVINSSANFFIYCFRDAKFRNGLFSVIGLKNPFLDRSSSHNQEQATTMTTCVVTASENGRTEERIELVPAAASNGSAVDQNGNNESHQNGQAEQPC